MWSSSTTEAPADLLRRAAAHLRTLAQAIPANRWGDRPWHAEECDNKDLGNCRCIVAQGKPVSCDQPQPVQYVADAETPQHAAWIAAMHPGWQATFAACPLAVARAVIVEETAR